MHPYLSVIIPAYNEEKRIKETLKKMVSYFSCQNYSCEIIVVDDGSCDQTARIAESFAGITVLRNKERKGKGAVVKKGVLSAAGDFILFSDADLSAPIEEAGKLLFWLGKGYHIAIGSRALPNSEIPIPQPFSRRLMGRLFNLLAKLIAVRGFSDTQCGFKCFEKRTAELLFQKQKLPGFCFDVEILYLAGKFKKEVKEVPIRWINSSASRVRPIRDSLLMLLDLFRIRLNNWRGLYKLPRNHEIKKTRKKK
ncbi:MAG: glycosyl transferase [bacterium (Candidatus Ratteibacteria) CG_4_10_14_3_um_filter_41_18]|uniref:dolichyl-phosphate beta-glucosyltransferase n=4 Tax=Candidatus Ratteibacteria TaxID=2979319 RepID=A0A2M7YDR8_9BACT|nr:MAG: hypothetical protein AUJ76_00565 [Candidatus Omnitrophica bacterium CG1_02_41_171]PIV63703.1 MAG: glycosyl transferase [bacterium (Candidatus Ratteibacteria) CG01_land_8_20_14_3_00_40_19]PIW33849.1 MAG: glycosyl transferase [bacterium (Candidatus Ratteibacteria) CG15_BIG_FIL_POST_REV_8_21_14_020_41_12]PIW73724.1 MAG: glycosyl transferase [bacterium (Candidatus Ratteibacteria) CG_4_8_14_3_um_filter_41_36]PIX77490.1 MAG: glycosyl transferase [bacterium (Candidatus Ratteibacteria) CG_4_10_